MIDRERKREWQTEIRGRNEIVGKAKLTPFLYGASSIASTSKSSAIARVGELSETPRISRPDFSRCSTRREKDIYVYGKCLRLSYLLETGYNVQTTSALEYRTTRALIERLRREKWSVARQRWRRAKQNGRIWRVALLLPEVTPAPSIRESFSNYIDSAIYGCESLEAFD